MFDNDLDESLKSKLRPSKTLLNIEYRIEQMSKLQRFEEAAKLKDQYEEEVIYNQ
jgi:hypothetical protein